MWGCGIIPVHLDRTAKPGCKKPGALSAAKQKQGFPVLLETLGLCPAGCTSAPRTLPRCTSPLTPPRCKGFHFLEPVILQDASSIARIIHPAPRSDDCPANNCTWLLDFCPNFGQFAHVCILRKYKKKARRFAPLAAKLRFDCALFALWCRLFGCLGVGFCVARDGGGGVVTGERLQDRHR